MFLVGTSVAPEDVRWIVEALGHCDTSTRLMAAIERQEGIRSPIPVALGPDDMEVILCALDDPPERLAVLRGVLLRDLTRRKE